MIYLRVLRIGIYLCRVVSDRYIKLVARALASHILIGRNDVHEVVGFLVVP
jgi:hypothetical protein